MNKRNAPMAATAAQNNTLKMNIVGNMAARAVSSTNLAATAKPGAIRPKRCGA